MDVTKCQEAFRRRRVSGLVLYCHDPRPTCIVCATCQESFQSSSVSVFLPPVSSVLSSDTMTSTSDICSGNSTETESEGIFVDESEYQPVLSILEKLRSLTISELARKRRVATNLPHDGKRYKKPNCRSDPKTITPAMRVKSHPEECFVVSAGKLFCTACREELSVKASVLQLHVKSVKHIDGKVRLQRKEKHERDIAATMKAYDDEVHPKGETLPMEERVYRVKCVRTFLKAGVPLNKIDTFQELLEENA